MNRDVDLHPSFPLGNYASHSRLVRIVPPQQHKKGYRVTVCRLCEENRNTLGQFGFPRQK
ncbi:hypothetical protein M413DRAFT_448805 [Hebeloma cylindrosporum]|uniref:Uncharacterized protein n=1 Tax=Hebeloma cylindrosporum TaxID=76867 RepID=A0A0C3BZJ4_HEBCY|nr:hypothetical protein M413DRAFT_448805 [Hebeloma cylindrosporum h7]